MMYALIVVCSLAGGCGQSDLYPPWVFPSKGACLAALYDLERMRGPAPSDAQYAFSMECVPYSDKPQGKQP